MELSLLRLFTRPVRKALSCSLSALTAVFGLVGDIHAQDGALQDTTTYHVEFDASVRFMNTRRVLYIALIHVDSAQVNVVPKPHREVITASELALQQRSFSLNTVRTITLRKRGAVGRATGKGALIGFLIGATLGAVAADDDLGTRTKYAIAVGIFPCFVGAIIGSALGSAKVVFPINGELSPVKVHALNAYGLKP